MKKRLADFPVVAATLKGIIIANELGGSPIANVEAADKAQTINPVTSDDFGRFTLEFGKRRVGDTVERWRRKIRSPTCLMSQKR